MKECGILRASAWSAFPSLPLRVWTSWQGGSLAEVMAARRKLVHLINRGALVGLSSGIAVTKPPHLELSLEERCGGDGTGNHARVVCGESLNPGLGLVQAHLSSLRIIYMRKQEILQKTILEVRV